MEAEIICLQTYNSLYNENLKISSNIKHIVHTTEVTNCNEANMSDLLRK
jgi:hypothetical protein